MDAMCISNVFISFSGVADEPLKVQLLGLSVASVGDVPPMTFSPARRSARVARPVPGNNFSQRITSTGKVFNWKAPCGVEAVNLDGRINIWWRSLGRLHFSTVLEAMVG